MHTDRDTAAPPLPPRAMDASGRLLPMSDDERRARVEHALAALDRIETISDPTDTDERWREVMRGIDEGRPERPLFEGRY
jgi:hypothetical protein